MIKKILIANRGEIAIRIAKTCRNMRIKTVGIYSEQDKDSMHLKFCDEVFNLGGDPLKGSYLNINKIIDISVKAKVDAIHPGYGFLSENHAFAKKLEKRNILFIGPPYKAIKVMGDKIESKKIAKKAGVNCIPGVNKAIKNLEEANRYSAEIGFPIMIKASAGGGGKGMRIAENKTDLKNLLKIAQEEAKNAFGDDRVFLEKYIELPRHIEIQIIGDRFGNIIWLGDRECSIQRRHQKIIEEAPSPFLDDYTREKMGLQAVSLAKEVGYYSAGTVEFVVDKNRKFFFLEMNTRLQVEHPVTEETSNIDLVKEMINIANGKKLLIKQKDVITKGWAFESRLCAENPLKDFLPSVGRISSFNVPLKSIRLDTGYEAGDSVSIYYDPLLAKIITKGKDREEARKKMLNVLENSYIEGVKTNLDFLANIYNKEEFISCNFNTKFIDNVYKNGYLGIADSPEEVAIMGIFILCEKIYYLIDVNENLDSISRKWNVLLGKKNLFFEILNLEREQLEILYNEKNYNIIRINKYDSFIRKNIINDKLETSRIKKESNHFKICYKGNLEKANIYKSSTFNLLNKLPRVKKVSRPSDLKSPMPGKVIEIKIQKGSKVDVGDPIIILDAMKMQNVLKSEIRGEVKEVFVKEGDSVNFDQSLISLKQKG